MIKLTEKAVAKLKEIIEQQDPKPVGLRISVFGGGCSGFSYNMNFVKEDDEINESDKTFEFGSLKVFVDEASILFLDGVEIDYLETLEQSGFKFGNPNVKSTCGCGQSFSA